MNIFWPEGLKQLAAKGEISFKDGERLNLNVVRKMENGMFLINLKGKSFTAQLETEPQGKTIRAEVVKTENGTLQLKIIPKAENSPNPMQVTTTTNQQGKQQLNFQLPQGTIEAKPGEKVDIQILKTLENGKTLIAVKNNLFEVKMEPSLLKNISAEVIRAENGTIELVADKLPLQNVNSNFVKQEVGTFDLAKLMKAFGKFQHLDIKNLTPESLKAAIKNSGLFMENKLLNNENIAGDEKARAYMGSDNTAREGITRMQVANMLLAGGLLTFLKTEDEAIDDTYIRMKKDDKGGNTLYVSTSFSQLGDTFLIIRRHNNFNDVMVKTDVDISEQLKNIEIENTRINWVKFNPKDLNKIDVKNDIVFNMGNFEVII